MKILGVPLMQHKCWQCAIKEKLHSLQDYSTWDLVSCPSQIKLIGCKWVYTIKLIFDGSPDRYKARLVPLRYHQENDIGLSWNICSYFQNDKYLYTVSSSVAKSWKIFQFEVKIAFLHGDLKEIVKSSTYVCRLCRSPCRLKQACVVLEIQNYCFQIWIQTKSV